VSPGVILDAGALIALERNERRVIALLARAQERGAGIAIPAPVLAQVIRRPAGQVRLMRLLRQPATATIALDRVEATRVGVLLADSGTSDLADAHVVVCARRLRRPVVTSDLDDLRRLDPAIELVPV